MKPEKTIKQFHFVQDGEPLYASLKPIKLKNHADLIDRIHNRYPYLNRGHLVLVINAIFDTMREALLQGHSIILRPFLPNFKLYIFQHIQDAIVYPALKVKVGTPQVWKERPSWIKRLIKPLI
jgi:hypothetical protein